MQAPSPTDPQDGAPLVSVVMPAFNAARTIRTAVLSVLGQTMASLELIVCDDASSDDTLAILESIDDSRLRVLRNSGNAGPGASRDRAIAQARGAWIAVIDSDDAWTPERLERLLDATGEGEDLMVFDDILKCHDTNNVLTPWERLRGPTAFGAQGNVTKDIATSEFLLADRLLIKPLMFAGSIRHNGIRHSESRYGEDAEFFLRILAAGARLRYVPEPMYLYRLTPESATANPARQALMKGLLLAALDFEGFGNAERAALMARIRSLDRSETYAEFTSALTAMRPLRAASLLVRHPWVLGRGARNLARAARYNLHRFLHGLPPTGHVR
jgi:succinoglycan biosynthesis protein ExoO